jgi:TPR repeat protein
MSNRIQRLAILLLWSKVTPRRAALFWIATGLAISSAAAFADDSALTRACDVAAGSPSDRMLPAGIAGVPDNKVEVNAALSACQEALSAAPENLRLMSQLARVFYLSNDYEKAHPLFIKAADQGYANAQFMVAGFYDDGKAGFPKNDQAAIRYYKLAADQGHPWAEFFLGAHYVEGKRVRQNLPEGARLMKLAADQGIALAQYTLGLLYEAGSGVPLDFTQAATWYRKAADQGNAEAKTQLAELGGNADTSATEIALACDGETFVLVNPATKYVKLQIEDSVLEFKDGVYGKTMKSGSMTVVAQAFNIPAMQQTVFVGEDLVRFGGTSKDGSYEKQYKLDRRSGLLSEENQTPKHCKVSKRF